MVRALKTMIYGFVGALITLLALGIYTLNQKSGLKIWHTANLDEEFSAQDDDVLCFPDYLALEDRLFAQLEKEVYDKIEAEDRLPISRFHRDSLSDPDRWKPNWNRSYELESDNPKMGVLLIHGLSDSPYSLRNIGEHLHSKGAHVLGLRVPGHGTSPSGLTRVTWQDMSAAVAIAMHHLKETVGERPIYVVGYSNGGALAVHYALSSLEDTTLPKVESICLISPEIGISSTAALAIWQSRIGRVLGLRNLQWTSVLPEYDPYKYNSFAVNAGDLAYKLTKENREAIDRLRSAEKLGSFPPVIAFQSSVDATVSATALVRELFDHLPERDHELVVFGLNRVADMELLFKEDPSKQADLILGNPNRRFTFTALLNADEEDRRVVEHTWEPGEDSPTVTETGLSWPIDIYSLSHVALPFKGDDPIYGGDHPGESPGIQMGALSLRGEKGVLNIPGNDMLRLRWNPFYSYLERRIDERFGLAEP